MYVWDLFVALCGLGSGAALGCFVCVLAELFEVLFECLLLLGRKDCFYLLTGCFANVVASHVTVMGRRPVALGTLVVGLTAFGAFGTRLATLCLLSAGFLALGSFAALGFFSAGFLALGSFVALSFFSAGFLAFGSFAALCFFSAGFLALGGFVALGFFSAGFLALGTTVVGAFTLCLGVLALLDVFLDLLALFQIDSIDGFLLGVVELYDFVEFLGFALGILFNVEFALVLRTRSEQGCGSCHNSQSSQRFHNVGFYLVNTIFSRTQK